MSIELPCCTGDVDWACTSPLAPVELFSDAIVGLQGVALSDVQCDTFRFERIEDVIISVSRAAIRCRCQFPADINASYNEFGRDEGDAGHDRMNFERPGDEMTDSPVSQEPIAVLSMNLSIVHTLLLADLRMWRDRKSVV